MTEGTPDTEVVTQHDEKAELYRKECDELRNLVSLHGWPKGWPQRGQVVKHRDGGCRDVLVTYHYYDHLGKGWISGQYEGEGDFPEMEYVALPCGETLLMLIGWLGDNLASIDTPLLKVGRSNAVKWMITLRKTPAWGPFHRESLTLALCAAVRAKMGVRHD